MLSNFFSAKVTLIWRKNKCGRNSQPGNYLLPEAKIFLRSMVARTVSWKEHLIPMEIYICPFMFVSLK